MKNHQPEPNSEINFRVRDKFLVSTGLGNGIHFSNLNFTFRNESLSLSLCVCYHGFQFQKISQSDPERHACIFYNIPEL